MDKLRNLLSPTPKKRSASDYKIVEGPEEEARIEAEMAAVQKDAARYNASNTTVAALAALAASSYENPSGASGRSFSSSSSPRSLASSSPPSRSRSDSLFSSVPSPLPLHKRQKNHPEARTLAEAKKMNRNTFKATHQDLGYLFRNDSENSVLTRATTAAKEAAIRARIRLANAGQALVKRLSLRKTANVMPQLTRRNNNHVPTTTMNKFLHGEAAVTPITPASPLVKSPTVSKKALMALGLDQNAEEPVSAKRSNNSNNGNDGNITKAAKLKRKPGGTRRLRF